MKIKDIKIEKYNFEKLYKSLPKELVKIIKDLDESAQNIYPDYGAKPDLKHDIAPIFVQLYYDLKTGALKDTNAITDHSYDIADRFRANYNDDIEFNDDENEDEDEDYDYGSQDEIDERNHDFNGYCEEALEKFAKLWNQGKIK